MDGKRIQEYWSKEIDALIETYQQFHLVPKLISLRNSCFVMQMF